MDDLLMETVNDIQDVQLIKAATKGDLEAFGKLVKQHESDLLAFALYRLPQREEAVEAVQDTFIRAYQQLTDFRMEADFGTWLRSICRFMILTRAKNYSRRKAKSDNYKAQIMALAVEQIESSPCPEPEDDLTAYLRNCTAELSEQNQVLIHDRYRLELSTQQISEKTGRTITWVTSTLHRVRSALRTCIENRMKECNHE
jgi:RNA polymerase sigma-70 factor (ECF subfamily)